MKNYSAYVQEASLLCAKAREDQVDEATSHKLNYLQEKIRRSELTVYQKEFLMKQLHEIDEAVYA